MQRSDLTGVDLHDDGRRLETVVDVDHLRIYPNLVGEGLDAKES